MEVREACGRPVGWMVSAKPLSTLPILLCVGPYLLWVYPFVTKETGLEGQMKKPDSLGASTYKMRFWGTCLPFQSTNSPPGEAGGKEIWRLS